MSMAFPRSGPDGLLLERHNTAPEPSTGPPASIEVRVSKQALARIAGGLYLILLVGSFFGNWVSSGIVKSEDATATADNIRSSATLFRVGLTVELVAATAFLFTAMALYLLLAHVDRLVAAAMVITVAVSAAMMSFNLLNHYAALKIATDNALTGVFGATQSDQLALLFTDLKTNGFFLAQMTFALWLLPLGYLVSKSGYVPKVFAILLSIAGCSLLIEMFAHLLDAPDIIATATLPVSAVAELSFFAWLIVKGVRTS
ncbi:MAG: DUF4386 domain-containing protein [Acidimicrobiales bacterium]